MILSSPMKGTAQPHISQMPVLQISMRCCRFSVREALKQLLDGLRPLALDIEEAGTVELVMAEALNNIVEHAYPDQDPEGFVRITCEHTRSGLQMTVIDRGRGMPDGQTPVGAAVSPDLDLCDIPEGGFGWFLINDLAKDVCYQRRQSENRLRLRLAVGLHSAQ